MHINKEKSGQFAEVKDMTPKKKQEVGGTNFPLGKMSVVKAKKSITWYYLHLCEPQKTSF